MKEKYFFKRLKIASNSLEPARSMYDLQLKNYKVTFNQFKLAIINKKKIDCFVFKVAN